MSLQSFTHNKNVVQELELTKHEIMLLKKLYNNMKYPVLKIAHDEATKFIEKL